MLEKYWAKANSGAQFSDLLRLDLLYQWGGVYVDSDLRLLKPLDDLINKFDFFIASEDGRSPSNALIGARTAHPAIRSLIEELLLNEPDWSLPPNETTGPVLFARALKCNKDITMLPRETFYSYKGHQHYKRVHRHSYGEHLWAHLCKAQSSHQTTFLGWGSTTKDLVKQTLDIGFRIWHRIKSLVPSGSCQPKKRGSQISIPFLPTNS